MADSLVDSVARLLEGGGVLPIVQAGDPVLRRAAAPFDGQLDDGVLAGLIEAMRRTMRAAPGVGLAAPQVGVPLRLAVLEDSAAVAEEVRVARVREPVPFRVLINPACAAEGDGSAEFFEGCLSVPGWQAVVARHATVRLTALDETGRPVDEVVSGWAARIVQHETDHLDGVLYLDRAEIRSLSGTVAMSERWSQPTPREAAAALGFRWSGDQRAGGG